MSSYLKFFAKLSRMGPTSSPYPTGESNLRAPLNTHKGAVDITANPVFQPRRPQVLFKAKTALPAWSAAGAGWDVSPDGKKFLFPIPAAADADRAVHAGAELNLSSQEMTGQVLGCPHNRPISAHSPGSVEFARFGDDLGEAVGESVEAGA